MARCCGVVARDEAQRVMWGAGLSVHARSANRRGIPARTSGNPRARAPRSAGTSPWLPGRAGGAASSNVRDPAPRARWLDRKYPSLFFLVVVWRGIRCPHPCPAPRGPAPAGLWRALRSCSPPRRGALEQPIGLKPLEVGQVAQGGESKNLQEFPRRDIGERRARLRRADGAVDQALAFQRGDDVAADLPTRQPGNLPPGHRLQIGDRRQGKILGAGEVSALPCPAGMRDFDRRREPGFGSQRIAAGDEHEIVRARAQLFLQVGDQVVEFATLADKADERLARNRARGGEDHRFHAQHPFSPAGGQRQVGEFRVEPIFGSPPAAARGGGHRPYIRKASRPDSSRTAPSVSSRSNRRRAERPVMAALRAASAGETPSSASSISTTIFAGFARSFGATASSVSARRDSFAPRSSADAAARAIAPAAAFAHPGSPGFGRRSATEGRSSGSRIFPASSGSGRSQRRRRARVRSNAHNAKTSASAGRASAKVGYASAAPAAAGSPGPAASFRRAVRPSGFGSARSSSAAAFASRRASSMGGRGARSRQSSRSFAAGLGSAVAAKRRSRSAAASARSRRILALAAALSARRWRSAAPQGGSRRRKTSSKARPAPAANSALPSPARPVVRPQDGTSAGGANARLSGGLAALRVFRRWVRGAPAAPRSGSAIVSESGSGSARITVAG